MSFEIGCTLGHRAEVEEDDAWAFAKDDSWPCAECGAATFVVGALGKPSDIIEGDGAPPDDDEVLGG